MAMERTAPNVVIREMEDSDKPFIQHGLTETNWQDIPEDQKHYLRREESDNRIIEDFNRYLRDERFKFRVFVAENENGHPVGYVSTGEGANPAVGLKFGAILDLWVAPDWRNRGIGSKLLDYAHNYIRNRGYSHASILVSGSNERAIRMYEKRGFSADRIVMMRHLKETENAGR